MSEENFRFCKKCLTRDMMDKDEYFKSLHEMIAAVSEKERAADDLYEDRLSTCKECEKLFDGLCAACGCYVELRAVIATNHCPYEKW